MAQFFSEAFASMLTAILRSALLEETRGRDIEGAVAEAFGGLSIKNLRVLSDRLERSPTGGTKMLQHRAELRYLALLRFARGALCVLVTLAALSVGMAGGARAQQCEVGNVLCPDNLCYPLGYQCCAGGGACPGGNNCWSGGICCPSGTYGTTDGYCIPVGFPDYCGGGKYCVTGHCDSRCASGCCL